MKRKEFLDTFLPMQDAWYRLAMRFLTAPDEARDAVQEVFAKLWKGRKKLDHVSNPQAYSMQMVKNYALDRLKSKQASNLRLVHSNYPEKNTGLQRSMELKDEVSRLFELMKDLPQQQQLIIQLRDVEGYDYDEIATIMEMKETAIRVALSRARKSLREQLEKQMKYRSNG